MRQAPLTSPQGSMLCGRKCPTGCACGPTPPCEAPEFLQSQPSSNIIAWNKRRWGASATGAGCPMDGERGQARAFSGEREGATPRKKQTGAKGAACGALAWNNFVTLCFGWEGMRFQAACSAGTSARPKCRAWRSRCLIWAVAALRLHRRQVALDVLLAAGEHGVYQPSQLMGGGLDRLGGVHAREAPAMRRADGGLAVAGGARRHAQRLPDPVGLSLRRAPQPPVTADARAGRQAQPRAEVLGDAKRDKSKLPRRLAAMVAASALQRPSRNLARTAPSRSPATMARTINWPVLPMMSLNTLSNCTFICVSAFCMYCTARLRSRTSWPRWRRYERIGHSASGARNAPRSSPKLISCRIHWRSSTSLLRPLTCFVARGFTRCTSKPARSSTSNTGSSTPPWTPSPLAEPRARRATRPSTPDRP